MDISAAILESAKDGAKMTRIMYESFISYPQLKDYLELLTDQGLLKYVSEEKAYSTTKRGEWFLRTYSEMNRTFPLLGAVRPPNRL